MSPASNTVVGVDFGAPRRTRDQRRKVIAIAADAIADRRYRVDAIGMNARLLVNDPPGWSAKELLGELLTRTVRIIAFDFPFSIPDALLRDEKLATNAGTRAARSSAGSDVQRVHRRAAAAWRSARLPPIRCLPLARRPRAPVGPARHGHSGWGSATAQGQVPGEFPDDAAQERGPLASVGVPSAIGFCRSGRARGSGEVIELYPGATLRQMAMANYKSRTRRSDSTTHHRLHRRRDHARRRSPAATALLPLQFRRHDS